MPHARSGLLDKRRTVAGPGFNRWLVPPAALCVHLCIGMAYGFSVFWIPLTKAVGITHSIDCPQSIGLLGKLTTTTCDWDKPLLGWMYTLFFVCLGSSAALFGMASPMLQEIFGGRLLGTDAPYEQLDDTELGRLAAMGAGFTGLLSLFNILGRFFWSSLSDLLGRKMTYSIFFLLGLGLYSAVPMIGRTGQIGLFCGVFCIILSMYGGGFAAIPAYLADLFGSGFVGAIHGRLLTAWSVAGILGPVLVNSINEAQVRSGVSRAAAYDQTMLVLAGLLAAGFICNALVFPLSRRASQTGPATTDHPACPATPAIAPETTTLTADTAILPHSASRAAGLIALSSLWLLVTIPIAWGLWATIQQSLGFLWSR